MRTESGGGFAIISQRLAQICQEMSGELISIFKQEAYGYKHRHAEVVTNNIRHSVGMMRTVDTQGRTIMWTRGLPPADELVPFPAPIDRALELFDRMKSARHAKDAATIYGGRYWRNASALSTNDVEALRVLTTINRKLDDVAAERRKDPTQFRREVTAELKRILDGKPVAIRMKPEALEAVLRDGRFKSMFETGKSAGEPLVERRVWLERIWFGYDRRTLPDDQRPIYGYVMLNGEYVAATGPQGIGWYERLKDMSWKIGIGHSDRLSAYGEVQVVLKPEVLQRTTFTIGDSLNDRESAFPSHILNPQPESYHASPKPSESAEPGHLWADPLQAVDRQYDTAAFTKATYAEAQVHGKVTLDDIDHVLLPSDPAPELRRALDDNGVAWKVHNNETIARDGTSEERAAARERIADQRRWLDDSLAKHMRETGAGPSDPDVTTAYERREVFDREYEMLAQPQTPPGDTGAVHSSQHET
ncbi:hypothetical protein [Nocardia sp. NPDC051463]|uniref:hypothetical protein n=1 Tax=Nocardia sp. NPDC051463 TaxID=3154845 RepID=UPI00344FB0E3